MKKLSKKNYNLLYLNLVEGNQVRIQVKEGHHNLNNHNQEKIQEIKGYLNLKKHHKERIQKPLP